jgi:cytochrome c oxidase subunit IV
MAERTKRPPPPPSLALLAIIGALLIALALGTYGVSRLDLGRLELPVALAFATAKAILIALFFMHLRHQGGGATAAVLVAVTFVLLLMGLVLGDLGLRGPGPPPSAWLPLGSSGRDAPPR